AGSGAGPQLYQSRVFGLEPVAYRSVGTRQRRPDGPAADPQERADLGVVVAVVVAEHQGRADLRAEAVEGPLDDLAPGDLVGRVRLRRALARRRSAAADRERADET